jgi:DNA processing protein
MALAMEEVPLMKIFIPFVRTPINILRYTAEHTPGFNRFSEEYQSVMNGTDELLKAEMRGREAIGAMTVASIGMPIGVVASGLDVIYPRENADLWKFVGERGLLLSESPPGTMPEAFRFPMRNRILAALSEVLVVVESRTIGGSMITVEEAQKRDITVMAVPGSPRNSSSAGTNLLLQQGCAPVVDVQDVLVALGLDSRGRHPRVFDVRRHPNAHDQAVLVAMCGEALTLDQVLMRTQGDLVATALALGRLESDGWVVNNSGWWEVLGALPAAGYGERSR